MPGFAKSCTFLSASEATLKDMRNIDHNQIKKATFYNKKST